MKKEFLENHLGMLIYDLGEKYFDCIKDGFWEKHINQQEPFTEKQIETFKEYIEALLEDIHNNKAAENYYYVSNSENDDYVAMVFGDESIKFKNFYDEPEEDKEYLESNNYRVRIDTFFIFEDWGKFIDEEKSYAYIKDEKLNLVIYGIPDYMDFSSVFHIFKTILYHGVMRGEEISLFEAEPGNSILTIVEYNGIETII